MHSEPRPSSVEAVHTFLLKDFNPGSDTAAHPDPEWARLRARGTRLWLDTGDREAAAALWCSEFTALTTNNTLLNREIQKGLYDHLVREIAAMIRNAAPAISEDELKLEVAFTLNAYHGLRLVEQFNANVSVELHTDLSTDTERTIEYGRRYAAVCPEHFIVKIPLTPQGIVAARVLGREGIPVNFTLGFSARQNYLVALLAQPAYVNVFMGRLNTFVETHGLGDGRHIGEKATLATQRALIELRSAGRTKALLIGASMRDESQVADLAGLDVYTMPVKVAEAYRSQAAPNLQNRIQEDPPIHLADGVTPADFAGDTLWEVPDAFRAVADELADRDVISGEEITAAFESAGIPGLFPRWTGADTKRISSDGKIPAYAAWAEKLKSGATGLDALMTESALQSFTTDQAALDHRVLSLL